MECPSVCPECGTKHRYKRTAHSCLMPLINEQGNYIILTYGMPGGITWDNVAKMISPGSADNAMKILKKLKYMKKYYESLPDDEKWCKP